MIKHIIFGSYNLILMPQYIIILDKKTHHLKIKIGNELY